MGRDTLQCSQRWVRLPHSVWRWDNTGHRSIDASCQKYHNTMIHHSLKVLKIFYDQGDDIIHITVKQDFSFSPRICITQNILLVDTQ